MSRPVVLHYVGYDEDWGGIISVVRALATAGLFESVLGMNVGAVQRLEPKLPVEEFPRVRAERPKLATAWQSWRVARLAKRWLRADARRVLHAHSRTGLLVALWLRAMGERRVAVSVHTFGTRRWLYRFARTVLGRRLFWLSPGMKYYYGAGHGEWSECLPGCIPAAALAPVPREPGELIRFGAVGPLAPYKRWDLLIRALSLLAPEVRRRIRVVHAGAVDPQVSGEQHGGMLLAMARQLGVEDLLEWRGRMRPLTKFWEQVDCLLAVAPIEAFSVAVIEAVGAGRPAIVSDVSGTSDFVRACDGGWLFAGDSPAALAEVMNRVVRENRLAQWRPNREALTEFTAPRMARRYLDVYTRLIAG